MRQNVKIFSSSINREIEKKRKDSPPATKILNPPSRNPLAAIEKILVVQMVVKVEKFFSFLKRRLMCDTKHLLQGVKIVQP